MNKFVVFLVAGCLLLIGLQAMAQDGNLLENPGFEAPFNTIDGDPPREVAQGWTPWHIPAAAGSPSFANRQPEYLPTAPDTTRIFAGSDAQLITSFFATHDGGVLQRVTGIAVGTELRFSVSAYVWSTTFDELDVSDQDGDVFVQVGIDPTGGTDPVSASIVWSAAGVEQYDAYNEYEVEAQAAGDAVTVFVRTTIGVPVKNNNIYLDQAALTAGDSQPGPAASDTAVPPSETPIPPSETPVPPSDTPIAPSETSEPPSDTPVPATADNSLQLTATALIAEATNIAATATANAVGTGAAEDSEQMTATAISATQTAAVPSNTPDTGPDMTATASVDLTSTAIIADATNTASAALTATTAATTPPPTDSGQGPISDEFPGTILHTVRSGETVSMLAERYGSSISAIVEANGLSNYLIRVGQGLIIPVRLPNPATSTPTNTPIVVVVTATPGTGSNVPQPPNRGDVYIVQRGDTLSRIAQRFNTNVATLAQLNGIVNIDRIQAGQRLILPGEPTNPGPNPPTVAPRPTPPTTQTYRVLPGDTLSRISLRFGVPMSRIAQANRIINWHRIYIGQTLIIPS